MNLSIFEIALLLSQVLLIPLGKYVLTQHKTEITNQLHKVITEHYFTLDNLIDNNSEKIKQLESTLNHKAEIGKIKQDILHARIKDIEIYLGKKNGFQTRQINEINDSGFL